MASAQENNGYNEKVEKQGNGFTDYVKALSSYI